MANSLPCPAWVWASGSNVHVAKDREWFGPDYTPINSSVDSMHDSSAMPVIGIGTVELKVKRSPDETGPHAHDVLQLKDVLHVPGSVCNIIGVPILDDYNVVTGPIPTDTRGTITDREGNAVAYFPEEGELFQVQLSDPPIGREVGPTPFDPSKTYIIDVQWPDSERAKWEASRGIARQRTVEQK